MWGWAASSTTPSTKVQLIRGLGSCLIVHFGGCGGTIRRPASWELGSRLLVQRLWRLHGYQHTSEVWLGTNKLEVWGMATNYGTYFER